MRIAMHDLKLDTLYVVYPGLHRYPIDEGVEAMLLWAVLPAARGNIDGFVGLLASRTKKVATIDEMSASAAPA